MVEPDTPCLSCSKPIQPGTGIAVEAGGAVHIHCLSGALRPRAVEAQSTGAKLQATADELVAISRGLPQCVFCEKPLALGPLLFSGKRPVHAVPARGTFPCAMRQCAPARRYGPHRASSVA